MYAFLSDLYLNALPFFHETIFPPLCLEMRGGKIAILVTNNFMCQHLYDNEVGWVCQWFWPKELAVGIIGKGGNGMVCAKG